MAKKTFIHLCSNRLKGNALVSRQGFGVQHSTRLRLAWPSARCKSGHAAHHSLLTPDKCWQLFVVVEFADTASTASKGYVGESVVNHSETTCIIGGTPVESVYVKHKTGYLLAQL